MTKRGILSNSDYLGEKGKVRQKWRVWQKFIKGLAKYSNNITKRGHLEKWRFYENDKFGKHWFKVWQKLKRDDKRGMSMIVDFTKMTYFAKPTNLERTETIRQQNRHIDSWRFSQKWQIWENGELGKSPPTVWQNVKWCDKEGNIDKRQISTNTASVPKIHQGFGRIFKWDDKKGHIDSWRFLEQWQILKRWRIWQEVIKRLTKIYKQKTKKGILTNGHYNKNANWATIHLRYAKIKMRWQTKHVDNCEFYENEKFDKNL